MSRLIAFGWYSFKLVLLPVSIGVSAVWPQYSFVETFGRYQVAINNFLGGGDLISWIAALFAMPLSVMTWLIPSDIYAALYWLAAIGGPVGFFVALFTLCALISPPKFLLAGKE